MPKALLAALLLGAAGLLPLAAQSNQFLDQLLDTPEATLGQAAYLLLTAKETLDDGTSAERAAEALAAQGWQAPERAADEPLTLGEYCFLLMQAYEVKGGLMYRIVPGPRYAARELDYRKLIRGKAYPNRTVSGEEALGILRSLLQQLGEKEGSS